MVHEMTRAHPSMLLPSIFAAAAALATAAGFGVAACNSDDREQYTSGTSTTAAETTDGVIWTTGEVDETTSTGPIPPSPNSCRDAIACAIACAIAIPNPTPDEYNWQACFFTDCLEELNYVEWLKLFDLMECVVGVCSQTDACMMGDDEGCNNCYLLTAGNPAPPDGEACEVEAKACK
jgi:hypothetical protein